MNAAQRAKQAVEALVANAEWNEDRRMVLSLVLEHLVQSESDRKAQGELRRRIEKLEREYAKVVAGADKSEVIPVDMSPGLAERHGIEDL